MVLETYVWVDLPASSRKRKKTIAETKMKRSKLSFNLVWVLERGFLCIAPVGPGTHFVDQADLELTAIQLPLPPEGMHHHTRLRFWSLNL